MLGHGLVSAARCPAVSKSQRFLETFRGCLGDGEAPRPRSRMPGSRRNGVRRRYREPGGGETRWRLGRADGKLVRKCKSLDLIRRSMSDFAIHLAASIIGEADRFCQGREPKGRPEGRPSQATGYGSRRRSRCSASLTESIRSPNSPP
jgi:hypothetical protein